MLCLRLSIICKYWCFFMWTGEYKRSHVITWCQRFAEAEEWNFIQLILLVTRKGKRQIWWLLLIFCPTAGTHEAPDKTLSDRAEVGCSCLTSQNQNLTFEQEISYCCHRKTPTGGWQKIIHQWTFTSFRRLVMTPPAGSVKKCCREEVGFEHFIA